jgi:hypothetical protein
LAVTVSPSFLFALFYLYDIINIMKSDILRTAGELHPPSVVGNTLVEREISLTGPDSFNAEQALRDYLGDALTEEDDPISYVDTQTPHIDKAWLLDRFYDASNGINPGRPTIKLMRTSEVPKATPEDMLNSSEDEIDRQLQRFYQLAKITPRPTGPVSSSWGADANKLFARVRVPEIEPRMKSLLHELGHCSLHQFGLDKELSLTMRGITEESRSLRWDLVTGGLAYKNTAGEWKGCLVEEAVVEGVSNHVNRNLQLFSTYQDDPRLPSMMAPYISENGYAGAAPSALALELIAGELGIPSQEYFRMFVNYGSAGVHDMAAREEVAASVYKGTRGRLTLGMIEELPYPVNSEASLALLWAVEDALDIPDHEQYSAIFAAKAWNK